MSVDTGQQFESSLSQDSECRFCGHSLKTSGRELAAGRREQRFVCRNCPRGDLAQVSHHGEVSAVHQRIRDNEVALLRQGLTLARVSSLIAGAVPYGYYEVVHSGPWQFTIDLSAAEVPADVAATAISHRHDAPNLHLSVADGDSIIAEDTRFD